MPSLVPPTFDLGPPLNPAVLGHIGLECEAVAPAHPNSLTLVEYCRAKSLKIGLPLQSEIKLQKIASLLANLFIAERSEQGWRYRLCGTAISDWFGIECTGKTVQQIFEPDTAAMLEDTYEAVSRFYSIGASRGHAFVLGRNRGLTEAVHSPLLARDGKRVLVFGGVFFL